MTERSSMSRAETAARSRWQKQSGDERERVETVRRSKMKMEVEGQRREKVEGETWQRPDSAERAETRRNGRNGKRRVVLFDEWRTHIGCRQCCCSSRMKRRRRRPRVLKVLTEAKLGQAWLDAGIFARNGLNTAWCGHSGHG